MMFISFCHFPLNFQRQQYDTNSEIKTRVYKFKWFLQHLI